MSENYYRQHIFTTADQEWFASYSGDYNPLHLDPVEARRELTGGVVAHGVHVLLHLLEMYLALLAKRGIKHVCMKQLSCRFRKPVYLDRPVIFRIKTEKEMEVRLEAGDGRKASVNCRFEWSVGTDTPPRMADGQQAGEWPTEPDDVPFTDLARVNGRTSLGVGTSDGVKGFPAISRLMGADLLADLLAVTRVVGMKAPGKRSMLASFDLEASGANPMQQLEYVVSEVDDRVSMIDLRVRGAVVQGSVSAFYRPEPKAQAGFRAIRKRVAAQEFIGQKALVVGGSRGIGEATAKIIAAGGGQVMVTYYVGDVDAQSVCEDINAHGGRASCARYNVLNATGSLDPLDVEPTHIYFFPTPRLTRTSGAYDPALFDQYARYYVKGFADLYRKFSALMKGSSAFLYPSTVAIDERTPDLLEYIDAKEAGEALCRRLVNEDKPNRIRIFRFPLIATDLTNSLMEIDAADAVDVLLPIIRGFHAVFSATGDHQ